MKADQLHDALTLLPETLLQPVDALRRKKHIPWKSFLATAACLCLLAGLALGYARIVAPASAENCADIAESPMQEAINHSATGEPLLMEVLQVEEDRICAVEVDSDAFFYLQRVPISLLLDALSQCPQLKPGQKILVYFTAENHDPDTQTITPYRIEIADE